MLTPPSSVTRFVYGRSRCKRCSHPISQRDSRIGGLLCDAGCEDCGPWGCCEPRAPMCCARQPGGIQERMKPWAYASMVFYAIGMPVTFAWILFYYRSEIKADQGLRAVGVGNTLSTNPFYQVTACVLV